MSAENGTIEIVKDAAPKPTNKMTEEELFAGSGAKGTFGTYMDPDKIVIIDDKEDGLYDTRGLDDVSESFIKDIEQNGILQNVTVRRNTETGKIEAVAGRRRILAARALKARGIPCRVPVMMRRGDALSLIRVMISENEQRKGDDPLNRARKMNKYLELGGTVEELAVTVGCSVSTVKNVVGLLDAPKDVQKAVESGKINAADGYKIAKLAKKDPEEAKAALESVLDADKTEGPAKKKRAKKKAALAQHTKSGHVMRGKKELTRKLEAMETEDVYKKREQEIVVAVLKWVLGNDRALGAVLTKI